MQSATSPLSQPEGSAVFRSHVARPQFHATRTHHASAHMRINLAHAIMLGECELLSGVELARLVTALGAIESSTAYRDAELDARFEDFSQFVEHELGRRTGRDTAGRLNIGRSRNDTDHTAFKMVLRERLLSLLESLHDVCEGALSLAERERDTVMVAYTHGQPAQPTTFGHYLGAIVEMLQRDVDRLLAAGEALRESPLGAAAVTSTGFPIDRERSAELLGFDAVQENAYGCVAASDYVTGVYAALKVAFVGLGRVAQDLDRYASFEQGYLHLPPAHCTRSATMPQKRNPTVIEQIRARSAQVASRCDAVIDAVRNTPFTHTAETDTDTQFHGLAAFDAAEGALALLGELFATVRVDEAAARCTIESSCITVAELADTLVRAEGVAYRTAHEVAGRVASDALRRRVALGEAGYGLFRELFRETVGRPPKLSAQDLARCVSVDNFIGVRDRLGGPAPTALAESIERYRQRTGETARHVARWRGTCDRARRMLEREIRVVVARQQRDRAAA